MMEKLPSKKDLPIYCLLDEFGNMSIPNFSNTITTIRKYKVSISIVIQDFSQLEQRYGKSEAHTIINGGITGKLFYAGADLQITNMLTQMIGNKYVNILDEEGKVHHVKEPILSNAEIRTMKDNEVLLIYGNKLPLKLKVKPYYKDFILNSYTKSTSKKQSFKRAYKDKVYQNRCRYGVKEFIAPILFRIQNFFIVLLNELQNINSDNIIDTAFSGVFVFTFFFLVSRFFRAYVLRLFFFMCGAWVLWQVSSRDVILHNFDFYGGLGMITPHLEIVEITYLLLKERTLFIYNQFLGLVLFLATPFIWVYRQITRLSDYFNSKQKAREDKKAYEQYYQEEFKQQQKAEWEKEQARQDEQSQREFREQEEKIAYKKKEKREYQEKKTKKTTSRWDSSNPYEVLGLDSSATKSEIKKAYRKLAKIYHPDLALTNTKKAEEIFQKINNAYESLG